MKLIIPTQIDDSLIMTTNVDEVVSNAWDSGTTYAQGSFCYVATGTQRDVYESRQAGNLNKSPATEADWWVFRSTTYDEYSSGATYVSGDVVIDTTSHRAYESQQDGNTGNALTDANFWLDIGATNAWRPFDVKVGSQTVRTGSIYYELTPGIIEGITFLNLDAVSIDIVMTDPTDGEVYNETIDLISTSNVYDGYSYAFAPILITKNTARSNLPPYGAATIKITINAESDTVAAKCGEIVLGRKRQFAGSAKYGAGFEIKDFSLKNQDDYGNYWVTERAFSNRTTMSAFVENSLVPYLKQTLEDYRAKPVVCIPVEVDSLIGAYLTYGYYRNAKTVTEYPDYSIIDIIWEGLT